MTLREDIQNRIANLADTALPQLAEVLDVLENAQQQELSEDFLATIQAIKTRNQDKDPEALLQQITDAVNQDRQVHS
ncbi:MAG: hypothetical protein AAF708_00545 [Deinococcota bacterium]